MMPIAYFLAITALFPLAMGIIAYDCGSRNMNITSLSLLNVGECIIPEDTVNVTQKYIQLLQIVEFSEVEVIQCKIEIHRTVHYCGLWSRNYKVEWGEMEFVHEISRESCTIAHRDGLFTYNKHLFVNVKKNVTNIFPITLAGSLDSEGNCDGAYYNDPYGSWSHVFVQGIIKITLSSHLARVNLDTDTVHLNSGVSCQFKPGFCIDSFGGYTYWSVFAKMMCDNDRYSILYEGLANKIINLDMNTTETVYSLEANDMTFALTAKGYEYVCGHEIIRTEHPKLVVFETFKGNSFAVAKKIAVSNLDIFAYVNSKFVYVEKHVKSQMKSLYRDIIYQRCNLERETLKNSLSIAARSPDEFAYNIMKGPGYMAVRAGEVVHLIKCVPVEVTVQRGDYCYAELEVTRLNKTYYMTPKTHVLKESGTLVNCNPMLPPLYFINNAWYKIMPLPLEAIAPAMLKPLSEPTWRYMNPSNLATSGIYTETDLAQLRDRIMFPIESPSILNGVAREVKGETLVDVDGSFYSAFKEGAIKKIVKNAWDKMWSKFITFGSFGAGVLTLIMIYQIIKAIIDIIIRGYTLHKIFGWSTKLLGALWASVGHLLINLGANSTPINVRREIDAEWGQSQEFQETRKPTAPLQSTDSGLYPKIDRPDYVVVHHT